MAKRAMSNRMWLERDGLITITLASCWGWARLTAHDAMQQDDYQIVGGWMAVTTNKGQPVEDLPGGRSSRPVDNGLVLRLVHQSIHLDPGHHGAQALAHRLDGVFG
jgi:hypothetical protein